MYRETRDLHPSDSIYNVDYRRPDLSELTLSQQNLDEEISTLKLSNELLMNIIQKENNLNQNEIFERLSTYRETGKTPFHYPYEVIRQSIKLQDENFTAFINNPDITSKIDTATLNAIRSNISPELYNILVEDLSAGEVKDHLLNNFGNTEISAFKNVAYLARYYGLSEDEIKEFLGEFVIENDFNTKEEYYYNDQLITVSEAKNSLSSRLLRRVYGINGNQFGYAELLPVSGNNYIFRFTTRSGPSDSSVRIRIGTTGAQSSNIVHNQHILRGHGVQVSVPVTFNDDVLSNGVTIGLTRYTSTGFFYATVDFRQERTTFPLLLLKLNKLIRLYCATGVSPRNIRTVLDSVGSNMKVTESTIKQLFWINQYIQHYSIDRREAMVLSNANISLISYKGESSDFDLLFNTPQLNKEYFSADSSIVNFKPDSITDTFRTGVLKRAFQINDTELYTLWSLVQGTPTPPVFTCNLDNISALYRIYLVAKIHHISISQLSMFISLPPFVGNSLGKLSREQLAEVMMKINLCIEWLNSRRISLNELYLMTTSHFDTSVTPEMNNLITTLQNGLANHSNPENEASYISTAASLLAAAAQLDSDETAIAVMDWIDKLKPSGLSVTQFLKK